MKSKVIIGSISIVFFAGLITTFNVQADGYTNVTVHEAKDMIDSNPSLVVLDVRYQSEYDSGHIENANLIPVGELEGRLDELNEDDEILVYCKSGGRSAQASQILVDNGFLYVYNMLGGITAWIEAGYPAYESPPSYVGGKIIDILPLNRSKLSIVHIGVLSTILATAVTVFLKYRKKQ